MLHAESTLARAQSAHAAFAELAAAVSIPVRRALARVYQLVAKQRASPEASPLCALSTLSVVLGESGSVVVVRSWGWGIVRTRRGWVSTL